MLMTVNMGNTKTKLLAVDQSGREVRLSAATLADHGHYLKLLEGGPRPVRILLSSVVPKAAAAFKQAVRELYGVEVEQVFARDDLGIRFNTVDYHQLGSDLFVNALASHHLIGGNLLNVDLGSASTFCVIKDGCYLGTSIVPGMELSIKAMISGTALLKEFELKKTARIINDDTISCLQSGIYYGYFELVKGMISRIKEEQGPLTVVLTGGIGDFLHEELAPFVDHFRPDLTMEGLQLVASTLSKI